MEENVEEVKDELNGVMEDTKESEVTVEQVKDNLDALIKDEYEAIDGYKKYLSNAEKVVEDQDLMLFLEEQLGEIIRDEEEHIRKLDAIKAGLVIVDEWKENDYKN